MLGDALSSPLLKWIYIPKRQLNKFESNTIIIALHIDPTISPCSSSEFRIVIKIGSRNTECYWKKKKETHQNVLANG